jgi:SAM-dependent methyltransferase
MNVQRTHDALYLTENRRDNPKEYFKFVHAFAEDHLRWMENKSILDVGCATGDFLWYLSSHYPLYKFNGVEFSEELAHRAQALLPCCQIHHGDIYAGTGLPDDTFGAVFMLSVHMIFDDFKPWIDNLVNLCDESGRIYVFGMFNPDPFDVLVKARHSLSDGPWEAGWNVISVESISAYLERCGLYYVWEDWQIPIDLARHDTDPLRGWTMPLGNGSRLITNGTCVIQKTALLEIRKT